MSDAGHYKDGVYVPPSSPARRHRIGKAFYTVRQISDTKEDMAK